MDKLKQPVLNIGIVGHIDHGKTTLVQKLTGKWTDTHSEELKRGITIKLGYADVVIRQCESCKKYLTQDTCPCGGKTKPVKYISVVDAPGHEMLMATMLSGAAIIDAAILVIAANEGIKPQTKEHLIGLETKGIKNVIIVQNKIDLVTKEKAKENWKEIKEFVKGSIAENAPIIPISAQQGVNIDILLEEITKIKIPERDTKSNPAFFIARSFDINKPGTKIKDIHGGVVGGILKKGILRIGDKIEIKPGILIKKQNQVFYQPITSKIVSLQSGNNPLEEAVPAGTIAIETELDPAITKADNLVGCVLGIENTIPDPVNRVKIKTHLFNEVLGTESPERVEKIKTTELLLLSVNTMTSVGQVIYSNEDIIELDLRIPIIPIESRIGIARNIKGHWRLIGWGELIK